MTGELTVLAPGLLGPVPLLPEQAPRTPALDRLLGRGQPRHRPDAGAADTRLTGRLLERFGAAASAPYARAADDPRWDRKGTVLHADPVHLRPDRDRLRLFDARHLGIGQDEAETLAQAVNAHLADDGLRLVTPVASRWYLELAERPRLETRPLEAAIGRHIDGLLPTGADASRWAALMTEVQMLLFQSPVNRAREACGRPAVNALWLSGAGEWRALAPPPGLAKVWADQPLARGLAMASGLDVMGPDAPVPGPEPEPRPDRTGRAATGDDETGRARAAGHDGFRAEPGLLLVEAGMADGMLDADEASWRGAVLGVEARAAQALQALRAGELDGVTLDLCDGRQWQLTLGRLRRFWRRPQPLAERLDQPPARSGTAR
ncbi:MAG: hypothetical protein ACLFS2_08395 [Halochromatium sp.]|uniref:hypothetical protein n=1 Tax=Halochromatium sp. TaxID=2049430 RepID=UPI00397C42DC